MKKEIVDFNHIDTHLSDDDVMKLKRWYIFYHKLYVGYKWKYKKLKRIRLALNMASISLVVIGGITGGATSNPIILGCISGPGVLIQGYITNSNISRKIEYCKFAHSSYKKVLTQIRSYLRGQPYDSATLLSDLKVLDDIVTDLCPPINGMSVKYHNIYGTV